MDSTFTAASLATGYMLGRELNYQVEVPPLGKRQRVPPTPVTFATDAFPKADPACLPRCPMVYAVITDSNKLGDPTVPDWQPQMPHGNNLSRPALVPFDLLSISLDVDCQVNTAFVTVEGTWQLHCIKQGQRCDCLLIVPINEQGIVIGAEVEIKEECYTTMLLPRKESERHQRKKVGVHDPELWCLKVPQAISLSLSTNIQCEFTQMVALKSRRAKSKSFADHGYQGHRVDVRGDMKGTIIAVVEAHSIGFGSIEATKDNIPPFSTAQNVLIDGMGDSSWKALYCCDWGLCGDCCCYCINQERLSCASCLLNCVGYTCQAFCTLLCIEACVELCGACCSF